MGVVRHMQRSIAKVVDTSTPVEEEVIEGIDVVSVTSSLQQQEFSPTHPLHNKFNHQQADQVPLNNKDLENVADHLHNSDMKQQANEVRKIARTIPSNGIVTIRDLSDRPLEPAQPTEEQMAQLMAMMQQSQATDKDSKSNDNKKLV